MTEYGICSPISQDTTPDGFDRPLSKMEFDNSHSSIETSDFPHQQILNPVFIHSRTEDSYGCLQVAVCVDSDVQAILGVGQMPFLYAIGLLQKAKRSHINVDGGAGRLLSSGLSRWSEQAQTDGKINRWDPWLFRFATGSRDEQKKFYSKVWRLHEHFDGPILVLVIGHLTTLILIEPDFAKLEVHVTLELEAGEARHTLTRDDVEGDSYILPSVPLPILPSVPLPPLSLDLGEGSCCSDGDTWRDTTLPGYYATGVD